GSRQVCKTLFYPQGILVYGEAPMDDDKKDELEEVKKKMRKKLLGEYEDCEDLSGMIGGEKIGGGGFG
ncbi:MAG: hypothetical protein ACXQTM_06280, partial [Methanosarcinales archaeon]